MSTKSRIIAALFRLAIHAPEKHQFTLAEIADEANLTRQAIYRKHFRSFEEVIEYIHDTIKVDIANAINYHQAHDSDRQLFSILAKSVLPVAYSHRDWVKMLHTTSIDTSWTDFFEANYQARFLACISEEVKAFGLTQVMAAQLVIRYTIAIISVWLSQEYPEPADVFESNFIQLMTASAGYLISKELPLA